MLKQESRSESVVLLEEQLGRVILGKPEVIDNVLVAVLSGSHILMEDVPGVGKTTLAKTLAKCVSSEFTRVQFTPDLLPTDILGTSIYNPRDGSFTFKKGPVFTNILLADEINRASPRTQSSLLEAMSEGQASIEGETRPLPEPFLVIATQNPVEFHGTYPLPEAQLDRFGMKISLGYPPKDQEVEILYSQFHHHPLEDVSAVIEASEVVALQQQVRAVKLERSIAAYLHRARRRDPKTPVVQNRMLAARLARASFGIRRPARSPVVVTSSSPKTSRTSRCRFWPIDSRSIPRPNTPAWRKSTSYG